MPKWKQKLELLLKRYGQVNLSEVLGVSQPCISQWYNGIYEPRMKHKQQILRLK